MSIIKYRLSFIESFPETIISNFNLKEKTNGLYENENNSFRKIWMESGFEAWILELNTTDDLIIEQVKLDNNFVSINFLDFNGIFQYNKSKPKPIEPSTHLISSDIGYTLKLKAFTKIKWVSLVFSKRWLKANLEKSTNWIDWLNDYFCLPIQKFEDILSKFPDGKSLNSIDAINLKSNLYELLGRYLIEVEQLLPTSCNSRKDNVNFIIANLIDTIDKNPLRNFEQEIIDSQIMGVSRYEIDTYTKANFGMSFSQYHKEKKMELGKTQLSQGKPLNEVAKMLGYSQANKLIRPFKLKYGTTPMKYINSLKKNKPKSSL